MEELKNTPWKKSSYSPTSDSSSCVEVAITVDVVRVRDTKAHGHAPILTFSPAVWAAFTTAIKEGDFDR